MKKENIFHSELRNCSSTADASEKSSTLVVQVEQGGLRGCLVTSTETGGKFYSFKGVPYAQPPTGRLRFRAPERPLPWNGIRDALSHGPCCPQFNMMTGELQGDEDCLFLNVYSPQVPKDGEPHPLLPVMVRIHGGGFTSGSGNAELNGPDFLVHQGVVLVTINYRLGPLGFLCVEEPGEGQGNAGLKDQNAALRWIRRNIRNFGGDPGRVTISGESAGGSSVHYHMLSPMSRGLFQYAISESGSVLDPWAFTKRGRSRHYAFRLGEVLGLTTTDAKTLLTFLRDQPALALIKAAQRVYTKEEKWNLMLSHPFPFVPTVEVDGPGAEAIFLHEEPLSLLKKGRFSNVPYMAGINNREGMITLMSLMGREDALEKADKRVHTMIPENLSLDSSKRTAVLDLVRKFYFGEIGVCTETIAQYLDLFGDTMFLIGFHRAVKFHASAAPLFLFEFSYEGNLNTFKNIFQTDIPGACHADELGYLFKMDLLPSTSDIPPDSHDLVVRNWMLRLWTNFAKFGNPTPESDIVLPTRWECAVPGDMKYMNIGNKLVLGRDMERIRTAFWDLLHQRYDTTQYRTKL